MLDSGDKGAWWYAAGMLAPVTEAEHGEDRLLELGLRSAELFPAFCAELGVELREAGTLVVARDRDEAEALDRLHAFRAELGLPAERLLPTQARRLEPALAPTIRLALDVPGDRAVDPRALVCALRERVPVRTARVDELLDGGVRLDSGEILQAPKTVLAAGAWSGRLADIPIRPVKGQVIRLRDPRGPGLVTRSIRTLDAYLVPRPDGHYVLGATVEERGWDTAPTAGGAFELIRSLFEVLPGVLELEIEHIGAGVRPATPDNLPLLGPHPDNAGLILATGHHRNGILLAPVTAEIVAEHLVGVPAA